MSATPVESRSRPQSRRRSRLRSRPRAEQRQRNRWRNRQRNRWRNRWRLATFVLLPVVLVPVVLGISGCGLIEDAAEQATATTPPPTTGPPPGASQAPGPPLATATARANGELDPTDPASVAAYCFARWQSFDARADSGPYAGVERARDCMTEDFAAALLGGASSAEGAVELDPQAGRAWEEQRAAGGRSTVTVLATAPLGGVDTTGSGRVALLLNARRETVTDGSEPIVTISTPALTLLRQDDGTWRVAGADLSNTSGDAPGR